VTHVETEPEVDLDRLVELRGGRLLEDARAASGEYACSRSIASRAVR
jgi:hypothetical protein